VYVLVAVEAFTKWVVLVPLPNKQPDSTAYTYYSAVYGYFKVQISRLRPAGD
jgi:hypothetical protein